jgi:hypothetical protein
VTISLPKNQPSERNTTSLLQALTLAYQEAAQINLRVTDLPIFDVFKPQDSSPVSTKAQTMIRLHELGKPVQEPLVRDARFPGNNVRMIRRTDGGAGGFYPSFVAPLLLRRALLTGSPEEALDWLEKVLSTTSATGKTIQPLWGAPVQEPIALTSNVILVPVDQIPESPQKHWITNIQRDDTYISHILNWIPPASALVMPRNIEKFICDPSEASDYSVAEIRDVEETLNDVALVLTIIGPRMVIAAVRWFTFDDPDLQEASTADSRVGAALEILPPPNPHRLSHCRFTRSPANRARISSTRRRNPH